MKFKVSTEQGEYFFLAADWRELFLLLLSLAPNSVDRIISIECEGDIISPHSSGLLRNRLRLELKGKDQDLSRFYG